MFYPRFVHCRRPKVLCPHYDRVQVSAPFERKNNRITLLLEVYAMLIAKIASLLRWDEKLLIIIMRNWVNKAVDSKVLSDVAMLTIDENSFKRPPYPLSWLASVTRFKTEDNYLLTTKLFCGKCGSFMVGESGTCRTMKVHHYNRCVNTKQKKLCDKKTVKKDLIKISLCLKPWTCWATAVYNTDYFF